MIKLIVFDWDDVFTLGSTEGYYACYHAAVVGVGVSLTYEEEMKRIASKWGAPHTQEIEALLVEDPELVGKAVEIFEQSLFGDVFVDKLSIIDGGVELLNVLSQHYALAIASGVHPKVLKERVFNKFQIPAVFSEIITAYDLDDPEKSKPHSHSIELIMGRTGVKPDETLMVGDGKNDILMAKNAHVKSVAVLTGHMDYKEAKQVGADYIIDKVTDLPSVLAQ